ncbi:MAG: TetR/AcrR family transcriptional regulator [Dehalococcoidia bacterium]
MTTTPVLERSQRAEQARAARSEEILSAARRVFSARGFRGTTIADIAEEAGIALGTIYLYFPSKEAVFAALNQQFAAILSEAVTSAQGDSLEAVVRSQVGQVFAACSENRDVVRLAVLNTDPETEVARRLQRADDERMRPLEAGLGRAVAAGWSRAVDTRIAARLIQGLVSISVYKAFVLSDGKDADAYRDECAAMIVAYLTPSV